MLFFLFALLSAWCSYNLYRPILTQKHGAVISFLAGWLVGELALHHLAVQVLATLFFVLGGAVEGFWGALGILLLLVSWIALFHYHQQGKDLAGAIETSLQQGLGEDYQKQIRPELADRFPDGIDGVRLLYPQRGLRSPLVTCIRDITYLEVDGLRLKLDIRHHHSRPEKAPVLFQIHGGAWTYKMGSKNEQALPLMNHLAERGWVCVSVDYRLSPSATFPEHIIDCKKALQWVKENISDYGGNPDFIIATGGSAGGHLSALLTLTPNLPQFQPGFEDFDSRIQGCVSFYGIYDFFDTHNLQTHPGLNDLLAKSVLKVSKADNRELYELASPISHLREDAPPFLLVQGDKDSLVAAAETRYFCERLREISRHPVTYLEIPGAQHAFDMFPSPRSEAVLHGIERFLAFTYSNYLAEQDLAERFDAEPDQPSLASGS